MKGFNKKLKRFLCNPLVKRVTMIVLFAMVVASVSVYFFLNVQESKKVKKSNLPEFDKSEKVLTIFTILRELQYTSLEGTAPSQVSWLEALHTYNAIVSWGYLQGVDILLFGDQKSCDFAMTFAPPGTVCLPIPCINKEFNVPRYDCLYGKAAELSRTEFLMYSNSDMVYFNDLIEAITKVSDSHEDFLMIGRRTDIMYPRKIEFEKPNWREELRSYVLDHGELHGKYGIDYFAYRTRHARKMPPFLVGRIRWDNWLVAQFIGNKDSVAVDSTKVVLAVHLNHMHVGGSHSRTGTDYNKELTSSERIDPKKIGDLDSTDLILLPEEKVRKHNDKSMGSCPKCTLKRNVQSMDVMLYKHSTDMTVIVSTVNFGYIDFAINWLCSLKKVGVRNYIFHAADETMFQTLFDMGLPVIYYASEQDRQYQKDQGLDGKAHDYGSVGYQGLMNTRTEFIYKIMQKGYNVLLCDVDIVFLKNPLKYLDNNLDIQGGAHKKEKLTGGYVYFRATEAAKKIWVKVLTQHRDMFNQIQTMENFNPHSMTEQELLNELLIADKKDKGEVKWGVVPEKIIADGKRFFIDKETQKKGEWPAAIHNNYVIGASNKRERFVNASLWMVEPDLSCKAPFPLPPPPTGKPKLVIKILAYNRPKSILRLFKSLDQAFYDGDKVDLEIYVDFPDEEDEKKEEVISDRTKVVLFSERFVWRHGKKDVIARTEHFGLANQWLNSWFPTDPNEVCLFIEDDNIVSPHFYRWLKSALNTYHTADNWDPRVFGLAMQNQHMIPGNYPKKPVEFLEEGVHFYKYQLLSTWGPVFFPFHWSQFLTWYSEKSTNDNFMPLFSNMITNTWFLSRGGGRSVWSAWFMRFAAERGLYCIYTNFELGRSFVVNYRDKGVNYKDDKGPNSNMVEVVEDYMSNFPNTSEIPIYDFHFNKIAEDPSILEGRAIYSDIYNIELH